MNLLTTLAQISTDKLKLPNKITTGDTFISDRLKTGLQLAFVVLGAISILIITIAALQYVLSNGDPQKTAQAKDTIIYAIIGLVVAILSWSIVTFVLTRSFG